MAGNSWGDLFCVTTFGESHGEGLGVVIDGCPSNFPLDLKEIQKELSRRRPGQSLLTTARNEEDSFRIISGFYEGKTTGAPLCAFIPNKDQKSIDYEPIKNVFRPSHADFTWQSKFQHRDPRGGGRSSARETAARVFAGAVAKQFLRKKKIFVHSFVSQVGDIQLSKKDLDFRTSKFDFSNIEKNEVRCPDLQVAKKMAQLIKKVKSEGDSIGGVISTLIQGAPVGLGEPVFDRFQADLAKAMLSLPAAKGFDYGSGFEGVSWRGSQHNDSFYSHKNKILTHTNHSGGVQGGITNGMDIYFRVAFKPVATIMKPQKTVNAQAKNIQFQARGRHDPCVVPRAVPIVEAMSYLVLMDHYMKFLSIKGMSAL